MVSEARADARAISIQIPNGEGGSGRRRFTSRNGTVIVEGRKTSPPSVVCVCVFMFLLVRALIFIAHKTGRLRLGTLRKNTHLKGKVFSSRNLLFLGY